MVTEMVSSEGLVRGIDRTLEYAEYTEEERPVAIQIFGGAPDEMATAAQVVENMGADIIDVNMGCPVPKIAKHNAGCYLMRDPSHAASIVRSMTKVVKIPVTVKMRAGWDERVINAPVMARMMEDAGAAAVAVHGRTAAQSYKGSSDWELIAEVASNVGIPVFGSGDCLTPADVVDRLAGDSVDGVLVGRAVLRNPWIFQQASALADGRSIQTPTPGDRSRFLLEYIDLLLRERIDEPKGFRHVAPTTDFGLASERHAKGHERWVVNKLRALGSWYTKGLHGGSQLRIAINQVESIAELRDVIDDFFLKLEPVQMSA